MDTVNIPSTPRLEIQLLGSFSFCLNNKSVAPRAAPRLPSFLAYLILHADTEIPRKYLAALLWPDINEEHAQTNLRKHLFRLREVLPNLDELLIASRFSLRWISTPHVKVDVVAFQQLLAESTTATPEQVGPILRRAIECYKGELLPGCYDEWVLAQRETLQTHYLAALARLSDLLEGKRSYNEAIEVSQRLLHHDPLNEASYRRLMRLYALNDDRAAALRTYHLCMTQLREELGIDPDAETQAIYERLLHGASPSPTVRPELAANAPFVGRQPEWQRLQNCWRQTLRGAPQFVLIAGEAGIGKSRLAEEMLNWATHQGFATIRSRCYAAEGRLTYAPIIEWLRFDTIRAQRSKLAGTWLSELARLLPELLSAPPNLPAPEPIMQSAQRHHLFEAVSRALLAGEQPLLLLIDDLQWCDKESLELLHFLLRNAPALSESKVLLIGTARLPDEVDAKHPLYELLNPLKAGDSLTQIDLTRLTESETADLANQMAESVLDPQRLNQLFADTAGNPLFVVETMRAGDRHFAHNRRANPTLLPAIEASEEILQHLPPKVLAVIQSRLAQLSAEAQELCQWAAIIGRSFSLDLLVSASKMAQDKAVNALDELWQRRILREQGRDEYDFSHDRIRDVAAAGASRVRRRHLHRCVAEALESKSEANCDNIAAQIAAHYDAAGIVEKAIHYFTQAADHAARLYAPDEAAAYLQSAIRLLKTLPESKTRDEHEFNLLVTLGSSLAEVYKPAITLMDNVYTRAYQLAQQLNVSLPPSMLRIWAIHKGSQRNFIEAEEMGHQLLELAKQQSTDDAKVIYLEGCYVVGAMTFWQGHFAQARAYLQKVIESSAQVCKEEHLIQYGQDTGIYCRTRLGWTLWCLGFPDQARQQCELAISHAKQLRHPYTLLLAYSFGACCACSYGDAHAAESQVRPVDEINGYRFHEKSEHLGFLNGWILLLRGNFDESIRQLVQYNAVQRSTRPDGFLYPLTITLLAAAYIQAKQYEKAAASLAEAFDTLAKSQEYWYTAEMYRLKGELLIRQGKYLVEAEDNLLQALTISRHQEAKSLELRAAMSMARLWDQQGKRYEARALLADIYNWFTEGFDTADLQEAKGLLEKLGK